MSLDVTLTDGDGRELYSANITHNLAKMARAAGIYDCLWQPGERAMAAFIIYPLASGLAQLVTNKAQYEEFNASNGWGTWEQFVPWCANYLQACRDNLDANVRVSV